MFVDASAIVAILLAEDDHQDLVDRMARASTLSTNAIALFEAMTAISRRRGIPPVAALAEVQAFVLAAAMDVQPIAGRTAVLAVQAFEHFGKGRGHPAQLNMGDCFSYAAARELRLPLLYKGNDFAETDLA